MAHVTALYAAILALIVIALAINVTVHRVRLGVPLGDGGNPLMARIVRMHGNAIEYIPIALLLMLVYELNAGSRILLHAAGIVLVLARLAQSADLWRGPIAGVGRIAGQSATWLTVAVLAIAILITLA
jgi:uncharacterized membrane protein YecN with MAPEG domain